ncbi:MAG TPA: hypothetical protein EYP69_02335 [Bacteroidales bacterium]|nr:hypothetical protein [Bacteroidales bacterium]
MIKNIKIPLITLVSFLILSSACSKKRIENNPELKTYLPLSTYFNTKKQQEQIFEIDSTATTPIIGQQGTIIYQNADLFMYPNGDSVHYPYYIGLIELYTPKDMIYYQMPTYGSNHILTTGGEIHIRAYKDSTELVLRPGKFYITYFPTASPDSSMEIFHGTTTGQVVDWIQSTDFLTLYVDSLANYYYRAYISSLGWINCDYFANYSGNMTTLNFISTTDDLSNAGIFIYFTGLKSILQVTNQTSESIPEGSNVKIICIAIDSNMLPYYYYQETTIGSSVSDIEVTMSPTTDAELETLLDNF